MKTWSKDVISVDTVKAWSRYGLGPYRDTNVLTQYGPRHGRDTVWECRDTKVLVFFGSLDTVEVRSRIVSVGRGARMRQGDG